MSEFTSVVGIDTSQAISALGRLDNALNSSAVVMGTFQGVADKNIAGPGVAELTRSVEAFGRSGEQAARRVGAGMQQANRSVRAVGLSFQDVARIVQSQIIFAGINAVKSGFFEAADAAAEFQLQIARTAAIAETMDFDEIRGSVEALAKELGRPLGETSAALYEALQNDLGDTAETMRILREEANQLALVTGGTLTQAVNALSSVYKTFSADQLGTTDLAGQFFGVINAGRITLSDLENSLGTLSPLASQLGVTFKELTDSVATITLTGTKANIATTQLRNVFNKLLKPTEQLKEAYKELGVTGFEQLKERVGGFVPALEALESTTDGNSESMARMFNTIRANVGVLNILTKEGELYNETVERVDESVGNLAEEINNIDATDARNLARNTAELEILFTRLGDKALKIKNDVTGLFLGLTNTSEEGVLALGSIGIAFGVATVAVVGFKVALAAALIPLAAFAIPVAAALGAIAGFTKLAEAVNKLGDESARLKVENLEAYLKFLDEVDAENIKEVTDAFSAQGTILNQVIARAKEAADEIKGAFKDTIEQSQRIEESLLQSFGDARTRVLNQVQRAISDIDNEIIKSRDNIKNIQQDIRDFSFEIKLEGMNDFQKAMALASRSSQTTARAFQLAANVGLSDEAAAVARETSKTAVAQAKATLAAAKQTGDIQLIKRAQDGVKEAMNSQLAVERNLNHERENVSKKQLIGQLEIFKSISAEARDAVREALEARDALAEAESTGAPKAVIEELEGDYKKAFDNAANKLDQTTRAQVLKTFDLTEPWNDAVQQLVQGIRETQFDFSNAVDQLREELATRTDLVAAVTLQAKIEELAEGGKGPSAGALRESLRGREEGGTADQQLEQTAEAVKNVYVEQAKIQNDIKRSALATELAIARARASIRDIQTFSKGDLFTDKSNTDPVVDDLINMMEGLDKMSIDQLKKAGQNLVTVAGEIEENITTGALGDVSENAKTNLLEAIHQVGQAVQQELVGRLSQQSNEFIEQLTEDLSTVEVEDIELKVDTKGVDAANKKMGELEQNGKDAASATSGIGTAATNAANGGVNTLNTATQNLVTSANSAKGAYDALLQSILAASRAAAAAPKGPVTSFFGGVQHRAAGGAPGRGQDTIPSMLSPGEFVTSARQTRNFLPELQAINSGNAPGGSSSSTNITIGDINVNSSSQLPSQSAREVGNSIKRELRRRTFEL